MIDHRYSLRRSIETEVIINYRALGLIHGHCINIGMGGMQVDLKSIQLPLNAVVDMTLLLSDSGGFLKALDVTAMVVHQAGGCVGLMFLDLDPRMHLLLHNLIYSAETPGATTDSKVISH